MAIRSRSVKPVTITNSSGQPEIVLEINGLTLSMAPPAADGSTAAGAPPAPASADAEHDDAEHGGKGGPA